MSLLNIPTKLRRSFPLASLSVLAKVAKARVAADLLPISEKEVRDLSFPSPTAAPPLSYHSSTSSSSSLSSFTHCSSLLLLLSLPRQRGFSFAWSPSSKAAIQYYASAFALFCHKAINRLLDWKPLMCKKSSSKKASALV